ncbi:exported hypothetical protein [uncultured Desulfobacterium sp.]|uniref:Uncharacterized protein n=1 Tax=uncultured Desulfobacterium sp. TaxID=201089 RepID=A0A445MXC7_9BACT|nr:exported hypothetical protein [uncultured Desulfobacterium sp.]
MKKLCLCSIVALFILLIGEAKAAIQLADNFFLRGLFRHQMIYNMGQLNPNNLSVQDDKNHINLSRTWLITELEYKPTDIFKVYSKMRFIWDQTTHLDDELYDYNAFPLSTPHYGIHMRPGHDTDAVAEIWELYTDLNMEKLWFRLGRQQIVWGEMVQARIMDIVNPLDYSWHFTFEPEEFENIRIPLWAIRGTYTIEQSLLPWLEELYIEGFYNPGDIVPNRNPELGNPYKPSPPPPWVYQAPETEDRWGEDEFGGRLGYRIGQVAGTFNYAYLYADSAYQECAAIGRPSWSVKQSYPQIDVFGMTLNYALNEPISTVVTFEGSYTPDYPWYDNSVFPGIAVKEADTWDLGIGLQRFTSIFPGEDFMNIQLQYTVKIVEDHDKLKWTPGPYDENNIVENLTRDTFAFVVSQDFSHKTYKAQCTILYQPDGAYKINPGFKYSPGDHWIFDIYASWWGGSAFQNANPACMNGLYYLDEIMGRITYQF